MVRSWAGFWARLMIGAIATFVVVAPATTAGPVEPVHSPFSDDLVPRWVTIGAGRANGRQGPTMDHPILWEYKQRGLPVEIIEETDGWRRVRDHDGDVVWMASHLVSRDRSVMVRTAVGEQTVMRRRASADSRLVAHVRNGVILQLEECRAGWCRVRHDEARGWVRGDDLFGVYPEETLNWG